MPTIIPIGDPADPRVEPYLLIRERDLVGRQGMFVAEGQVVLAMLIASKRYRPLSLLIAEQRVDALTPIIAPLPDHVPVYSAAQNVIDAIAGFPLHRGILAIGQVVQTPSANDLLNCLPLRANILLLSAIANHDNMGGIFRNAAAFGAQAILLDSECCDPLYRKAIRVSVGAALLVPFAWIARDEDPLSLLERHSFAPIALSPSGSQSLADHAPADRNAALLGAEGPGLSPALLSRCTSLRIPMAPGFDSLNVATTSGIVLHHLTNA